MGFNGQCKDTITAQIFRNVPKNRGYPYGLKIFIRKIFIIKNIH